MSDTTHETRPRYRDETWLWEQYVGEGRTMEEIAEVCDCSITTVSRWLNRHGIETRRTGGPAADDRLTDAEWLREHHVEHKQSTAEIAEICDCDDSTVRKWLNQHEIEIRSYGRYSPAHDCLSNAEWLRERYVKQNLTISEIAEICDCGDSTVRKWLNRHGIETRRTGASDADDRLTDPEWLREQYLGQKQSTTEIAELCDCSPPTVSYWLNQHGIETATGVHPRRLAQLQSVNTDSGGDGA